MTNKCVSFLSAIILLLLVISGTAFAAKTPVGITVSSASTHVGERITVSVRISKEAGIGAADIALSYDPECLELAEASAGDIVTKNGGALYAVFPDSAKSVTDDNSGTVSFTFASVSTLKSEGILFEAEFLATKATEDSVAVAASVINLVNGSAEKLEYTVTDGEVLILPSESATTTAEATSVVSPGADSSEASRGSVKKIFVYIAVAAVNIVLLFAALRYSRRRYN